MQTLRWGPVGGVAAWGESLGNTSDLSIYDAKRTIKKLTNPSLSIPYLAVGDGGVSSMLLKGRAVSCDTSPCLLN